MLLRIGLPSVFVFKEFYRILADEGNIVQWFYHFNAFDIPEVNLMPEDIAEGILFQGSRPEPFDDVPDLRHVRSVVNPFQWIPDAFGRNVSAVENVSDFVFVREVIH